MAPDTNSPDVLPSSTTMASSGSVAPTAAARLSIVMAPLGRSGREAGASSAPSAGAPTASASASRAPGASSPGRTKRVHRAPGGDQVARLLRVGEERDRRRGVDHDEVLDALELGLRHLGEVSQSLHRRYAGAALEVGREGLAQHFGSGGAADPAGRMQGRAGAGPSHREAGLPSHRSGGPWPRSSTRSAGTHVGRGQERGADGPVADGDHEESAGRTRVATHPGGPKAAATASAASAPDVVGAGRDPVPARDGPGDGGDVGLEGRVEAGVIGGVITHDVDQRRPGAAGVVEVGQPVAQPGPEVQQGRGRAGRPPGRSRRRPRWRPPRRGPGPRAFSGRRRGRPRNASPRSRDC